MAERKPLVNISGEVQELPAGDTTAGATAAPTGTVLDFAGSSVPTGFLECDGSAVSRTTYSALFGVVGTLWGVGDGTTTFNLPNLQGLPVWGKDGSNAVGTVTGSDTINIAHTHDFTHTHQIDPPNTTTTASSSQAVGILSLLTTAAPAGHTHDVNIPAFTSGAASTSTTDSKLSSTQDIKPRRAYLLKVIKT